MAAQASTRLRIYLVRHGATGGGDGLSGSGQQQAQLVGALLSSPDLRLLLQPRHDVDLPPDRVLTSPARCALSTAAEVARAMSLPVHVWPDLREVGGLGPAPPDGAPGMTLVQMQQEFPALQVQLRKPSSTNAFGPGGGPWPALCETDAQADARAALVVADLWQQARQCPQGAPHALVLVAHSDLLVAVMRALGHRSLSHWLHNGSVSVADMCEDSVVLWHTINAPAPQIMVSLSHAGVYPTGVLGVSLADEPPFSVRDTLGVTAGTAPGAGGMFLRQLVSAGRKYKTLKEKVRLAEASNRNEQMKQVVGTISLAFTKCHDKRDCEKRLEAAQLESSRLKLLLQANEAAQSELRAQLVTLSAAECTRSAAVARAYQDMAQHQEFLKQTMASDGVPEHWAPGYMQRALQVGHAQVADNDMLHQWVRAQADQLERSDPQTVSPNPETQNKPSQSSPPGCPHHVAAVHLSGSPPGASSVGVEVRDLQSGNTALTSKCPFRPFF